MISSSSTALIKKQESVLDVKPSECLPIVLQEIIASYLVSDHTARNLTNFNRTTSVVGFFSHPIVFLAMRASEAVHKLAHRINVDETLVFMRENFDVLQTFRFRLK